MHGEAIGEVAIADLARTIDLHPQRRIVPETRARRVAVAKQARGMATGSERRDTRA